MDETSAQPAASDDASGQPGTNADTSVQPDAGVVGMAEPQEHGNRLARNALNLAGNIGISLGSAGPTASIALTLAAIVAASSFASPIAILICGLPMLAIAAAFRRLNRWRVNCGGTYVWGGRAISPYFGFTVGWVIILAYVIGVISISLPIGPYVVSLFTTSTSRPGEAIAGFAAVVLATVIAYLGIRLTAWTQWILIAIEYTGVGILAIWCLVSVFSHNPHSVPFSWSWFSWSSMGGISGFIAASLIAVYLYSGWDTGILVNEETSDAREKPGQSVVTAVIVLALMYAFLTFALQGAVHTKDLEANGSDALSYIAGVVSGSALAKYMILAVTLSALGSTLASLVSGVRVSFAMGSDGVLPRAFGATSARFKTPVLATIVIGVIGSIGVWLYTFGSSSVQTSFTTVVSVDGLLFALYYALTGIATTVYYRRLATRNAWSFVQLVVFPLAAAGFLVYIMYRSVPGLGGWSGRDLVSLYVMLGIGLVIMLYVRFWGASDYFSLPRETYQPETANLDAGSKES
jgi:amino acid transporter